MISVSQWVSSRWIVSPSFLDFLSTVNSFLLVIMKKCKQNPLSGFRGKKNFLKNISASRLQDGWRVTLGGSMEKDYIHTIQWECTSTDSIDAIEDRDPSSHSGLRMSEIPLPAITAISSQKMVSTQHQLSHLLTFQWYSHSLCLVWLRWSITKENGKVSFLFPPWGCERFLRWGKGV